MHSIRSRPICRAHNTFSPSVALWQHFVAPNQHFPQRQLKSAFATEAAQSRDDETANSNEDSPNAELADAPPKTLVLKKVRTEKGNYEINKALYPKYRNKGQLPKQMSLGSKEPLTRAQNAEMLFKKAQEAYDSAQDYEGVTVLPVEHGRPIKESTLPWVPSNWKQIKSAEERLELEIQAFYEHVRPSPTESVARKHVIEQVRQHVRKYLPDYVLEVFGSERTGIAFAGSDIDLRLIPKNVLSDPAQSKLPPTYEERVKRMAALRKLHYKLLLRHKSDYLLPTIRWARYPLISLQDRASGLDIQIVLSNDTSVGREYMRSYMVEYPYLPQLYSVLKAQLDVRGLSDVFRGGIGSYSLFMMIVASLKHKPNPHKNASGALMHFLRFWSQFKAEEHGVSIEPVEFFAKSEQFVMHKKALNHIEEGKVPPLPPWMPTIRDPADETNDLGRKVIAWKHVQKTYSSLAERLATDMKQNHRPSLLAWHVGAIHARQQVHRKRLAAYGKSVAAEGRKDPSVGDDVSTRFYNLDLEKEDASTQTEDASAELEDAYQKRMTELSQLRAIAQAIREGRVANDQSAPEAEELDMAREAPIGEQDGVNPWLKDVVGESEHKETGEALSNLLGLDEKREAK